MKKVVLSAAIGADKYETKISSGHHSFTVDEAKGLGGSGKGPDPFDLLLASLVSCTAATLRMYVERKGWDIPLIEAEAALEGGLPDGSPKFVKTVSFPGSVLDENEQKRLKHISESCPVQKVLSGPISIVSQIV